MEILGLILIVVLCCIGFVVFYTAISVYINMWFLVKFGLLEEDDFTAFLNRKKEDRD